MAKKKTKEEFINDAQNVHGNKYDYSLVEYKNNRTKVKIICPEHGVFEVTPGNHISQKCGCTKCSNKFNPAYYFKINAKKIHNNKYDYSLVNYINSKTKIKIICPIHGFFKQLPNAHLSGQGCPKCKNTKPIKKLKDYLCSFIKIHKNFYDYSKTIIIGAEQKCIVTCPIHGDFKITPANHKFGKGCPKCALGYQTSKGEKEVLEYIKTIYKDLIIENNKKIILPYEIDIFLPRVNLAIEYNGHYWHKKREKEIPGYHKLKAKLCKEKGIKLINISDKQWLKNKNLCKEKILRLIKV